ncbi:uncharacterized protein LOC142171718 [Nicotiana tabacum]|uniref:Uncharacterized protein LOC142171718 n=1 Tax=Nicotiana tabacum TaxID=4097 RepID=A0AC58T2Q7_TOBAC
MNWFAECDRNTRFFHNYVNVKRQKMQLKIIQSVDGTWLESQDLMSTTAVEFFSRQFTQERDPINFDLLNNVPAMVTMEQNLYLCKFPTFEEVKKAVFTLSVDSANRPDANNWYSALVNGQLSGFFKSTRGVKRGDPLSPTLYILSADILTRSLNKLFEDKKYIGYGMPILIDPLNHLAYADDKIIFTSEDAYSLGKIVTVLTQYEQTSG